ncbi:type II toxin-antitoxin system RelE/ParE family toxin [Pararhizobium sp. YC-54]|uniref:type II toxin-antitoxin system RelE/ParE family toxin n=1 Tax=Pararhizobium sp. YC-54 TaxID=2986920 RepID=UPI0021F79121|nr:type II toxin-antitoxin system RelE/ParE family toxin [Pararhizobium sp. YC-54]MCV9998917.1 type II toxin-antitoxin system RelE/ParE family toxin [Pararhizobium sp. YC-54]
MRYRVLLHPKAEEGLNALYDTIAENAAPTTAWNFVSGIRKFCSKLSDFPERGTERVELMPGLRVIGYRRSVSIAFTVEGEIVIILGIFYGGRNLTTEMFEERLREE